MCAQTAPVRRGRARAGWPASRTQGFITDDTDCAEAAELCGGGRIRSWPIEPSSRDNEKLLWTCAWKVIGVRNDPQHPPNPPHPHSPSVLDACPLADADWHQEQRVPTDQADWAEEAGSVPGALNPPRARTKKPALDVHVESHRLTERSGRYSPISVIREPLGS